MVDRLFADPRLASLYDDFDGPRDDLDHYVAIAHEVAARSVLDVGCGTGSLALRLAEAGLDVTGIDPAQASLDVAQRKAGAARVRWLRADAEHIPAMAVDLAVMTGNVAQVFLSDEEWAAALHCIHGAVRPGGHFVFESRRPDYRAWDDWGREPPQSLPVGPDRERVTRRSTLTEVALPLVSFRNEFTFSDGSSVISESTLRFRTSGELTAGLTAAGFTTLEVRQAPDRPDREFVFIARKPG